MTKEKYIVSARKYRPTLFEDVIGQSHITITLKNAIKNNQLAQAILFCGPRGVGKTTCARILAKSINCKNKTKESEPCNQCDSCLSFNRNASFNIHELDAASNNSVDDIRNLVEQIRYSPQSEKYKIYIIDEVHMLSNAAFNAFLKTLEEPPSYAIFILATTEKHKIIPTILSRCQIFDFNRIKPKDIVEHLKKISEKENIKAEEEALNVISKKADGALRDALSMFDLIVTFGEGKNLTYKSTIENLHILDHEYYFKVVNALKKNQISVIFQIIDKIIREGFDGLNFIVGLSEHFRKLMMVKHPEVIEYLDLTEELKYRYLEQANDLDIGYIISVLNIANKCELDYKVTKNKRLCVELALINMSEEQFLKEKKKFYSDKTVTNEINKSNISSNSNETNITGASNYKKSLVNDYNEEYVISKKPESLKTPFSKDLKNSEKIPRAQLTQDSSKISNTDVSIAKNSLHNKSCVTQAQSEISVIDAKIESESKKDEKFDNKTLEIPNKNFDKDIEVNETLTKQIDNINYKKQNSKILNKQNELTSTIKIFDLEQISKKLQNKISEDQDKIEISKIDKNINEPLDKENINKIWNLYLNELKEKGNVTEFNILKNIEIKTNKLIINVYSDLQKEIFDEVKQDAKIYIENKLFGKKINLECNIIEEIIEKTPYTNKEKFEFLASKDKVLYDLKEKLELDLDV